MMSREEVIALMQTSRNEKEWNENYDLMVKNCGGPPHFWFETIMLSGIANKIQNSWISTAVRGNLAGLMPEILGVTSHHLAPPTDEEIAKIRLKQGKKSGW
jgi:hypothetical protein